MRQRVLRGCLPSLIITCVFSKEISGSREKTQSQTPPGTPPPPPPTDIPNTLLLTFKRADWQLDTGTCRMSCLSKPRLRNFQVWAASYLLMKTKHLPTRKQRDGRGADHFVSGLFVTLGIHSYWLALTYPPLSTVSAERLESKDSARRHSIMFFGLKWRAAPMAQKAITPRPERENAAEKRGVMQIFLKSENPKPSSWMVCK